jgi:hypothetical protein
MWYPKTGTVPTVSVVQITWDAEQGRHHKLGQGWESLSLGLIRFEGWEPRLWGILVQSWAGLRIVLRSNNQTIACFSFFVLFCFSRQDFSE